jgi:hypothetical protein
MKLETLQAIIHTGPDGSEEICRIMVGQTMVPLMSVDPIRFEQIKVLARDVARAKGCRLKIIQLTLREELGFIDP